MEVGPTESSFKNLETIITHFLFHISKTTPLTTEAVLTVIKTNQETLSLTTLGKLGSFKKGPTPYDDAIIIDICRLSCMYVKDLLKIKTKNK